MVEKIERIAATSPSRPTQVDDSTSITSEPDGVWVAHRQSEITAGLKERAHASRQGGKPDGDELAKHQVDSCPTDDQNGEQPSDEKLSGESERIGQGNWDEDVPFGEHVGYL
ncbi:hypothetical protein [Rhizobium sp. LCM 4573]|uniref:hypothetical protein n=1 Tax=Rhizobium sp. LCM 4573 TaxID=1848291 RepID=UPI0009F5AEC1|nr:hypothetical protein [Rhizobium sp. LCM 4573]